MTNKTILHHVLEFSLRPDNKPALLSKTKEENWKEWSWKEYYENIENFSLGLYDAGIQPGDRIALFANTRPEWCIADYAIMGAGAITVPIYQTVTPEDLEFILNDSQPKILIVENKSLLKTFSTIKERCPSIEKVVLMDPSERIEMKTTSWSEMLIVGKTRKQDSADYFEKTAQKCNLEDMATILYTSGTTGTPKGVVLTHTQIMSEITEAFEYVGARPDDTSLAFLPYAHVLGRIEHWGHAYIGFTLAFAESIEKIRDNLKDIKPTFLISVPRIFEKIYTAISAQIENNFAKSKIFKWALDIGLQVGKHRLKKDPIPVILMAQYKLAQELALNKIKEAFGGRLRFAMSGGAPMAKDIALFFHACDVLILEGYGLTETTAAICVNTPFDYNFGTVGKPIGDVKLKIAEDGEILVKSKKVMKEYYKNPEANAESFTEGWFHTGDIGEITKSGDLRITDRKKDLIKTAGGKYVPPQKLENLLKLHSFLSNVLIHGDQKKYVVALITLEKQYLINYAKDKNIQYADFASLTQHPAVLEMIRRAVAETNSHLANYETIKRFAVLPHDFTIEAGELTPSLKVKRKFLDKKYRQQIERLYS